MNKILLHACCAPCSVSVVEWLKKASFEPTIFWFNPNINPFVEFKMRKQALEQFAKSQELEFVDGGHYNFKKFLLSLNGKFNFKTRCQSCYFLRLRASVEFAKKNGFKSFSTTLLVSPYQNHNQIISLAESLAKGFNLEFFYFDFRQFFRQGQQKARQLGLYMQKYCGCIFSEEERFNKKARKQLEQVNGLV